LRLRRATRCRPDHGSICWLRIEHLYLIGLLMGVLNVFLRGGVLERSCQLDSGMAT